MSFRKSIHIVVISLLTIILSSSAVSAETKINSHNITVEINPSNHSFKAVDVMQVETAGVLKLYLNKNFKIVGVDADKKDLEFTFNRELDTRDIKIFDDNYDTSAKHAGLLTVKNLLKGTQSIRIKYEGVADEAPRASRFSRQYVADITPAYIGKEGTYLSPEYFWYPVDSSTYHTAKFTVKTYTPEGYESVTQGKRTIRKTDGGRLITEWVNEHPADACYLQAGPYVISEDEVEGVKIYTYFFKGSERHSKIYLEKSKKYIKKYSDLLGKYPYSKFAVVENFFETGYGMPSWTLLGKTVIRLPWIPDTSLPHEIVHNWWGNSVYVDYEKGNWCEGLTMFCADYLLKLEKGEDAAAEYRRNINREYAAYVNEGNDFPLTEFKSRHNPAERAIGYGKSMMVFQQLYLQLGHDTFFDALKAFYKNYRWGRYSWEDLISVFEDVTGNDYGEFYKQWIKRKGAPQMKITFAKWMPQKRGFALHLELEQSEPLYQLYVPIRIKTRTENLVKIVNLSEKKQLFKFRTMDLPEQLQVDANHDVFRLLYPEEIPASISVVYGDKTQLIILPTNTDKNKLDKYRTASEMINKTKTGKIIADTDYKPEMIKDKSVILLGSADENGAFAKIMGDKFTSVEWNSEQKVDNATSVYALKHPSAEGKGILVIETDDDGDILSVTRKLPHYGKYSYLTFAGAKNIAKGTWNIKNSPLVYNFPE